MNYIINPWIIYLIDRADAIKFSIMLLLFVSLTVLVFVVPVLIDQDEFEYYTPTAKKVGKIAGIIFVISLILVTIFPNSQTVTKMVVASYVTEENVEKAKEQVVEIVDYIFEKVDDINKED